MFGILSGLVAVPAIVGTTEAVRQGQRQNAREQHRGRKSNLVVNLPKKNIYSSTFDGALIILKDHKLYIDTVANQLGTSHSGHPFAGYYLPHPQNQNQWKTAGWKGEGMVSTISDDPPMLNWIYVDVNTCEVKYGTRVEAEGHLVGPWDCTEIDKRVTFEGWEGFLAVQESEEDDLWALYFDRDNNALKSPGLIGNQDIRRLAIEVSRKERPKTKQVAEEERIERLQRRQEEERKKQQREQERQQDVRTTFQNSEPAGGLNVSQYEEEIDE